MRVLLLAGHASGGIGAHVADLATGLAETGVSAVVATSEPTASRFDLGPDVRVLWPAPAAPATALRRLRALRRLLAGADVVHAHGHQAGLLAVLLARTLGRRRPAVVVSWHNAVLGTGLGRRLRAGAEVVQARGADLLAGASSDLVARARRLGARDPELAPVAAPRADVRPHESADAARALAHGHPPAGLDDVSPGTEVVLTVGRIAPQKDLPTLVRAAARLKDRPLLWALAGDGDAALEQSLHDQAARSGAPLRLLGARRDVADLLARADVFALSSTWEARSLAVQEAMAAGVPVVATRTGGLPDLLDGVGELVPVGDDAALAAAVAALLDDPGRAEAAARRGREAFAALPSPADVLRSWGSTYARVQRPHRP